MPKITGTLTDFGFSPMPGMNPRLYFQHNTPGVSGAAIMSTKRIEVIPVKNGLWEAELVASARIAPAGFYTITLEWSEPPSRKRISERFPGRLYVPAEGGILADILRVPANPALVWTGTEPPPNPTPGTWWLNDDGILQERNDKGGWTFKQNTRGPAGYNAVGALPTLQTLADYTNQTAGPNAFAAALLNVLVAKTPRDISVKDAPYKAKGDGVTDDTAAVNKALAAGGIVRFPPGTYLLQGTMQVESSTPTHLIGPGATLLQGSGSDNLARLKNAAHTVDSLTFSGVGTTKGNGLIIEGTAIGSTVKNCTFISTAACGVQVQKGADGTKISGNTFKNCGLLAASPFFCTLLNAANNVITENNHLSGCNWGIYYRGTEKLAPVLGGRIANNVIFGQQIIASQGISAQFPANQTVTGNHVERFADNGIDHMGGVNCNISNNTIRYVKDGVFIGHMTSNGMTVQGNSVHGCERGVRVWDGAQDCTVSGNTVYSPVDGGIQIMGDVASGQAQPERITVTGNSIRNSASGAYGIEVRNALVSTITNNSVWRPRREGIRIIAGTMIRVGGNTVVDAGTEKADTYPAISTDGASARCLIDDNMVYGFAKDAVSIGGGPGNRARGNRWRSITGGILDSGINTRLADNEAY